MTKHLGDHLKSAADKICPHNLEGRENKYCQQRLNAETDLKENSAHYFFSLEFLFHKLYFTVYFCLSQKPDIFKSSSLLLHIAVRSFAVNCQMKGQKHMAIYTKLSLFF